VPNDAQCPRPPHLDESLPPKVTCWRGNFRPVPSRSIIGLRAFHSHRPTGALGSDGLARPTHWRRRRKAAEGVWGGPKRLTFRDKKKTEKKKKDQTPENAQCPLWAQNVSSFPPSSAAQCQKFCEWEANGERKTFKKWAIQLSNRPISLSHTTSSDALSPSPSSFKK
jgi:hypothetical protein